MGDRDRKRMLELAESMGRLGLAMSMLGVKGAVDLLSPEQGWERSASAMDAVKDSVEAELGEEMGGFYRAGERLQKSMLDGVFQMGRGAEALSPDRVFRGASEMLRHSADWMSKTAATEPTPGREPQEDVD